MKKKWIILIIIVLILAIACFFIFSKRSFSVKESTTIANPASSYCINNGGELEIRTDVNGGQYGVCKKNGLECEEWKFLRGECVL